jgi:Kelch motif/Galactose oxidase, central domain
VGEFFPGGSMIGVQSSSTATRLRDGRVLIAGGYADQDVLDSAQLYDPATNSFSSAGSMTTRRSGHTATLLADGRVLIAGGTDGQSGSLASAELYQP